MNKLTIFAQLDIQATGKTTLADIESYLTEMLEVPQDPETEPGEPFYVTDLAVQPRRPIPPSILIAEAASLLSVHGENTEYDRGVAELTAFLLGQTSEGIKGVLAMLRSHPQHEGER